MKVDYLIDKRTTIKNLHELPVGAFCTQEAGGKFIRGPFVCIFDHSTGKNFLLNLDSMNCFRQVPSTETGGMCVLRKFKLVEIE